MPPLPDNPAGFDLSSLDWSELETNLILLLTFLEQIGGNRYDGVGGSITELTIASGVVTPTVGYHLIDTESDAASDDLTRIDAANLEEGQIIVLQQANISRDVTIKHNVAGDGKISMPHGADWNMQDKASVLVLQLRGTTPNRFWDVLHRGWGNSQAAIDERDAFLGIGGRVFAGSSGSWTAPGGVTTIYARGVGGGGGGGGGSNGITDASAGGDGGDTLIDISGGANLATFAGGKGGGGGYLTGRGGVPPTGSSGGVHGADYIALYTTGKGGEARPTSLGDYGKGGRGGDTLLANTGGSGASGSVTLDQYQVLTVTPGTTYDITIGAAGALGARSGASQDGSVGVAGGLLIEW